MTLFWDYLRRSSKVITIISLAVFAFQLLMVRVFVSFVQTQKDLSQNLPRGIQRFFDMERLPISTFTGFMSVAYQHPVMLAIFIALPVIILSGLLTADVERRISAFILARPVSRISIVLSAVAVFVVSAIICIAAAFAGSFIGARMFGQALPQGLGSVGMYLFFLMLAVGGICAGFSAVTAERADASGWTVTIILLMYVLNFVAELWPALKPYAPLSLFDYYNVQRIFQGGAPMPYDFQVLGLVFVIGVAYACLVYRFRDFNV